MGRPISAAEWDELRARAREVAGRAHAPYSQFAVGAAGLVDDGRAVVGCNVESASYGLTLCAECGVITALHAGGGGRLVAVAVTDGGGRDLPPCGRCRQLLVEAGGPDLLVNGRPMRELLPDAFGLDRSATAPGAPPPTSAGTDTGTGTGTDARGDPA